MLLHMVTLVDEEDAIYACSKLLVVHDTGLLELVHKVLVPGYEAGEKQ